MTEQLVARARSCVTADLDGSTVVLSPDMQYIQLDAVGAAIWSALTAPTGVGEIVATLHSHFDVDEVTLTRDVVEYLHKLRALGLVVDEG